MNIRDGQRFTLSLEQNAQRSKTIPQTYGYVRGDDSARRDALRRVCSPRLARSDAVSSCEGKARCAYAARTGRSSRRATAQTNPALNVRYVLR